MNNSARKIYTQAEIEEIQKQDYAENLRCEAALFADNILDYKHGFLSKLNKFTPIQREQIIEHIYNAFLLKHRFYYTHYTASERLPAEDALRSDAALRYAEEKSAHRTEPTPSQVW